MSATHGINVAIIGVGLVGSSVIQQLTSVAGLSSKLHIVALQNSKKTLLSTPTSPISLAGSAEWKTLLANSPTSALALPDLVKELEKITRDSGRHTAVVDNTSDEKVAAFSPRFPRCWSERCDPQQEGVFGQHRAVRQDLEAQVERCSWQQGSARVSGVDGGCGSADYLDAQRLSRYR